jgi:hypothetical protein
MALKKAGSDSISTQPGQVLRSGGVRASSPLAVVVFDLAGVLRFFDFGGMMANFEDDNQPGLLETGEWVNEM